MSLKELKATTYYVPSVITQYYFDIKGTNAQYLWSSFLNSHLNDF